MPGGVKSMKGERYYYNNGHAILKELLRKPFAKDK